MAMELRPYQQEARDSIFEQWDSGIRRTLLVLPTGCGKTIVFAKVTEDCVRHGDRVLILAHRGELLEQAADKIASVTGLGCATEKAEETCIGSWFRITVGSVQTLMRENGWDSSRPIISGRLSLMKPITAFRTVTSGCCNTSRMRRCWE